MYPQCAPTGIWELNGLKPKGTFPQTLLLEGTFPNVPLLPGVQGYGSAEVSGLKALLPKPLSKGTFPMPRHQGRKVYGDIAAQSNISPGDFCLKRLLPMLFEFRNPDLGTWRDLDRNRPKSSLFK